RRRRPLDDGDSPRAPPRRRLTTRTGRLRMRPRRCPMQAAQIQPTVRDFVRAPLRKMLIDGEWVEAASGETFETPNAATGEVLARVAEGDAEDIDRAVRAARRAFDGGKWPATAPAGREALLLRIADLIEKHGEELAQLETLDNGKTLFESRNVDIPGA